MTVLSAVWWVVWLFVMMVGSCQSRLVAVKMKNATNDLAMVQTRVSQLSLQYEQVEGVCGLWARERKKQNKPHSCVEVREREAESGLATIYPAHDTRLEVFCDQDTDGGGWTVFQRRQDGSVDFYRNWTQYQQGFGDLNGEFWLGLDALYKMTSTQSYELRVDLSKFDGTKGSATYTNFSISDSSDNYRLHLGDFTGGNAGDCLSGHNYRQFSTYDADHDSWSGNCAFSRQGAWWYGSCGLSNLNGLYGPSSAQDQGVVWYSFNQDYALQAAIMKLRPV